MGKKNNNKGPDALGRHFLVELWDCNHATLESLDKVKSAMIGAAKKGKATIIDISFHEFSPFGISGMVVIARSYLSIHAWPEHNYAAVDIFICGAVINPQVAAEYLIEKFGSKNSSIIEIKRGYIPDAGVLIHKPPKTAPPPISEAAKKL